MRIWLRIVSAAWVRNPHHEPPNRFRYFGVGEDVDVFADFIPTRSHEPPVRPEDHVRSIRFNREPGNYEPNPKFPMTKVSIDQA